MQTKISDIVVEERARKEYGDLTSLERSIAKMGVLQPIGIASNNRLIFGGRRLQACKNIGLEEVPVRVFDIDSEDPAKMLQMEREENEHRKDLTVSEKTELAMRIEESLAGRQGGDRGNQYTGGKTQDFADCQTVQGESRDIAAKAVGMNRESYRQSKWILASGDEDLIRRMESGELSIHAAYKELIKPRKYTCPDCEEELPEERWHCWRCHNHVDMGTEVCPKCQATKNGHEADLKEAPVEQPAPTTEKVEPTPEPPETVFTISGENTSDKPKPHVTHNSGNNEWYTPADYAEAAREVLGEIFLDPASSTMANDVIKARNIYTERMDGLAHDWEGTVWLNPPYSSDLVGKFADKLLHHYVAGDVPEAIVLVNNATETQWFRRLVDKAAAVVFPTGRVLYWTPDGVHNTPLQGQAILYFGKSFGVFLSKFTKFGWGAQCWNVKP